MTIAITRRAFAALLAAAALAPAAAVAAPRAELWTRWAVHDPAARSSVDHAEWDRFLAAYLARGADGVTLVAYGRVTAEDRRRLDAYLAALAAVAVGRLSRDVQRAYWINLYNALTVKVVLDHYPVKSIMDIRISPGFFAPGPWGRKLVRIEGEEVSLDDVEHRILRPIWRDPRLHYALNCASIGCPDLQRTAFTEANTDALLDAGARGYVNHWRGVGFDGAGLSYVSSIYNWFVEDFGRGAAGVLAHLRRHAEPALARRLEGVRDIPAYQYDWRLNDVALAP